MSCWTDWLGFPFHSALVTRTAIILTGWLNLKWQVWADVSLHPCPTLEFWCTGHAPLPTQRNPALLEVRAFLPYPPAHSQLWCPCPYTWFLFKSILLPILEPSGVVPAWGSLDRQGPHQWYALPSQFPVESTPQSKSASAQQKQCFPGWSQWNK